MPPGKETPYLTFERILQMNELLGMSRSDVLAVLALPGKLREATELAGQSAADTHIDFSRKSLNGSNQLRNDPKINQQLKSLEDQITSGKTPTVRRDVLANANRPGEFLLSAYNENGELVRQRRISVIGGVVERMEEMDIFYLSGREAGEEVELALEVRRSADAFLEKIHYISAKLLPFDPTERDMLGAVTVERSSDRQQGDFTIIEMIHYGGFRGRASTSKGMVDNKRTQSIEVVGMNIPNETYTNIGVSSIIESEADGTNLALTRLETQTYAGSTNEVTALCAYFTLDLGDEVHYDPRQIINIASNMDQALGEEGWEVALSISAYYASSATDANLAYSDVKPRINFFRFADELIEVNIKNSHHFKDSGGNWQGFIWQYMEDGNVLLLNYLLKVDTNFAIRNYILTRDEFLAIKTQYKF